MVFTCDSCPNKTFKCLRGLGVHRGRGGYCSGRSRDEGALSGRKRSRGEPPEGHEAEVGSDSDFLLNNNEGADGCAIATDSTTFNSNNVNQSVIEDDIGGERAVDLPPFPSEQECGKYLALQLANDKKATRSQPLLPPLVTAELEFLALIHRWYYLALQ